MKTAIFQVTRSAERVTNTAERKEGEESLTITDIQRSVHSSKALKTNLVLYQLISCRVERKFKWRLNTGRRCREC